MNTNSNTIKLATPIKRGTQNINTIELRKPCVRELSGLSLVSLANMEVDTMMRMLPRISVPALTDSEVGQLDPADLVALGGVIESFLVKIPTPYPGLDL